LHGADEIRVQGEDIIHSAVKLKSKWQNERNIEVRKLRYKESQQGAVKHEADPSDPQMESTAASETTCVVLPDPNASPAVSQTVADDAVEATEAHRAMQTLPDRNDKIQSVTNDLPTVAAGHEPSQTVSGKGTEGQPDIDEAAPCSEEQVTKWFDGLGTKTNDHSGFYAAAGLTTKQHAAYSLRLEFELPLTQVARRMGIDRKTAQGHIDAAKAKIDQNYQNRRDPSARVKRAQSTD
jgi:hypothetical protein